MDALVDEAVRTALITAAVDAGVRIMADWGKPPIIIKKPDGSPVTATDDAAEAIVLAALRKVSDHPIIAEEQMHAGPAPSIEGGIFWLVDALDGTREFIHAGKDFTVNIALIEAGVPVFGVIHAPAFGLTWHATKGRGAWRIDADGAQEITMRPVPTTGYHVLAGKRAAEMELLEPFLGEHEIANRLQRSSSIKFCMVAQGEADLYPRLGATYEWDTAAGDIVMREAGGVVLDIESRKPIVYGKAGMRFENGGFIAGARGAFKGLSL